MAESDTYGAITRTARMLARKTRSQVRVPPPPIANWRQVTILSVATGAKKKTASCLLANSANPFDAAYSPHYVPTAGDTAWVVFIGTSPQLMALCQ
ncbi:MAG: hypothetical protein JWO67_6467 [Streptosporangiaceae bacterium]|nr:hypothetical protein [Streptosporangiaceae bacterium]